MGPLEEISVKPRRTQSERSSATRQLILEAAIRCLVELGYAATSTTAIQSRAGVSRGALTHQFPSKQGLMIAAIDHFAEVTLVSVPESLLGAPPGPERVEWILKRMWEVFDSDLFMAALELWAASRTDPALRDALLESEPVLGRRHRELLAPAFGESISIHPGFRRAYEAVLLQMRGAVLTNLVRRAPLAADAVVGESTRIFRHELELQPEA